MGDSTEFMKKLSRFEIAVLGVTAAFALFACGYFAAGLRPSDTWRVETQRNDSADVSVSQREEGGWPDSLLAGERININTAPAAELERLPGIGASRAQAIVADREQNGPYRTLDELSRVAGIGTGIVDGLRPYAAVS